MRPLKNLCHCRCQVPANWGPDKIYYWLEPVSKWNASGTFNRSDKNSFHLTVFHLDTWYSWHKKTAFLSLWFSVLNEDLYVCVKSLISCCKNKLWYLDLWGDIRLAWSALWQPGLCITLGGVSRGTFHFSVFFNSLKNRFKLVWAKDINLEGLCHCGCWNSSTTLQFSEGVKYKTHLALLISYR